MFTKDNIDAFLEGLAILGTGGGGSPEWGKIILENDMAMGRTVKIVNPEDVPDDATVAIGVPGMTCVPVVTRMRETGPEMADSTDVERSPLNAMVPVVCTVGRKVVTLTVSR